MLLSTSTLKSTPSTSSPALKTSASPHSLSTTDYIVIGACIGMAFVLSCLFTYHYYLRWKSRKFTMTNTTLTPYTVSSSYAHITTNPFSLVHHYIYKHRQLKALGRPPTPLIENLNAREVRISHESSAPPSYVTEEERRGGLFS